MEQSEILCAAKIREFLDWETIDRLTEENSDFKSFVEDLMEAIKLGKIKSKYDKTLAQYVHEKGILRNGPSVVFREYASKVVNSILIFIQHVSF